MENIAQELIIKHHQYFQTYDPFELAEKLNISVLYVPFLSKPLGRIAYIDGKTVILISDSIKKIPMNFFICAHELYHATQHKGEARYYLSNKYAKTKMEVEANNFATTLIKNHYAFKHKKNPNSFSELQNLYGVPNYLLDHFF